MTTATNRQKALLQRKGSTPAVPAVPAPAPAPALVDTPAPALVDTPAAPDTATTPAPALVDTPADTPALVDTPADTPAPADTETTPAPAPAPDRSQIIETVRLALAELVASLANGGAPDLSALMAATRHLSGAERSPILMGMIGDVMQTAGQDLPTMMAAAQVLAALPAALAALPGGAVAWRSPAAVAIDAHYRAALLRLAADQAAGQAGLPADHAEVAPALASRLAELHSAGADAVAAAVAAVLAPPRKRSGSGSGSGSDGTRTRNNVDRDWSLVSHALVNIAHKKAVRTGVTGPDGRTIGLLTIAPDGSHAIGETFANPSKAGAYVTGAACNGAKSWTFYGTDVTIGDVAAGLANRPDTPAGWDVPALWAAHAASQATPATPAPAAPAPE